jgi:starch phosphorylase
MLRDEDRLKALLLDPDRPVQFVIAGKSHPADDGGKQLIAQMVRFADDPEVRHRIAFLPDYDIGMARYLMTGVDVWLNNPLRPLEACGTSGMKAALNGALNLSILDGWWDEWYDGENGWAIPSAEGLSDPDRRDDLEADALYELIEKSVAPRFYDRHKGVATRWVQMVRHTLKSLGPKVLATRMVAEYVRRLYVPAAASSEQMFAADFAAARELASWRRTVEASWPAVAVLHVDSQLANNAADAQLGSSLTLRAEVALGGLQPEDVRVQAVYGSVDADDRLADVQTTVLKSVPNGDGTHRYEGEIPLDRTGTFGYTVRVLPDNELLTAPAELGLIASA